MRFPRDHPPEIDKNINDNRIASGSEKWTRFKEEKQKKKRAAVMHDRGLRWIPVWYTG